MNVKIDTKAFKRELNQSKNYHRKGLGSNQEAAVVFNSEYQSSFLEEIRRNNNCLKRGNVTIHLAEYFSFCWGVDRAVAMVYETRLHFPQKRIWITNEIIHNPEVNQRLREMDIKFIPVEEEVKDFSVVDSEDVVILPAAGATVSEMKLLKDKGCTIVDTTCPWVMKVWNSVEKQKKRDYTSIIHGKYKHEETVNTSSFAGKYLIVVNIEQAKYVSNYILNGGDKQEFFAQFAPDVYSEGFDPDIDLERIGIANQTTMLKSETEAIGKLFEKTMLKKYGPTVLNDHFMSFNTICYATQERQDAMLQLIKEDLDVMLVIGGFHSSNTTHLHEIAIENGLNSYHIDRGDRIGLENSIEHKPLGKDIEIKENWLPNGEIVIGITAGASTPKKAVEAAIQKIFQIKDKENNLKCELVKAEIR